MITRKGKIARLANNIRETLNNRLDDGETGATLVEWLNSLPEVQQILAEHFHARPITEQNLSEWKQGGFADWKQNEDKSAAAENVLANSDALKSIMGSRQPSACLIPELAITLAELSRAVTINGLKDPADQKCLFKVADRILGLQRGEQREEKLSLERRRVEALERRHRDAWIHTLPKTLEAVVELLKGAMKSYGHTEGSADAGVTAMFNYFEMILEADTSIPAAPPVPAACGEREGRTKSDHIQVPKPSTAQTQAAAMTPASENPAPKAEPTSTADPTKSNQPTRSGTTCESSPKRQDNDLGPDQVPDGAPSNHKASSPVPADAAPLEDQSSVDPSGVHPAKSGQIQAIAGEPNQSATESDAPSAFPPAFIQPGNPAVPAIDPEILSRWTDGIEDVPEFFPEYDESSFRELAKA